MPLPMRFFRHIRQPASLPKLIWKNLTHPFSRQAAETRYDRRLGIETTGWLEPQEMDIGSEAVERGHAYIPTPPRIAQFLIDKVAKRARGFTFVDVGSGKGRVLFIAARFSFHRVVGIEHSAALNEIAAENARRFAAQHPGAAPVELLTGDATQLLLPDGPLVVFLFNPFGRETLTAFAQALKAAHTRIPRKIICIYYNAVFPEILSELGLFTSQEQVDYPPDSLDHFSRFHFPAMIFES